MGSIYKWQDRVEELDRLWKDPPRRLKDVIFHRQREDIRSILRDAYWFNSNWVQLEDHCVSTIKEVSSSLQLVGANKSEVQDLCAWNSATWFLLLEAIGKGQLQWG